MSRYGRIERGHMAADRFTQVSNQLARDKRLSRRARGLFLEISSHRDGYGLTVESLVRSGPEGREAIMSGLRELERYGYLARHQERDERGRMGTAVYRITDSPRRAGSATPPTPQARTSRPSSEIPTTDEPASVAPSPQKTNSKKTNHQKTDAPPPSLSRPAARARERERRPTEPSSAGTSLLLEIGSDDSRLAIGGQALSRQGERLDALLATGWDPLALRAALTGGLPATINHPAAFLARRITHIPDAPTPPPQPASASSRSETYTPPPFGRHIATPPLPECDDCGVPPVPGHRRCAACMGWPYCPTCRSRRVFPTGNSLCGACDGTTR
ncbi:hypothetical protein ACTWP5_15705 [Streptomyces sp. 4N509B]|uniref:hypothetical protein n=1 Tax=Streptomyces sp. 4N509B TaxID=3457413 RepID=UPI003FCF7DA9